MDILQIRTNVAVSLTVLKWYRALARIQFVCEAFPCC